MISVPIHVIEGLINLISAVGIIHYLVYIYRNPHRTLFEERIGIMLSYYCSMIIVRGCLEVLNLEVTYAKLILGHAMFLPLVGVLFVEGMIRRHVPHWLKIYCFVTPFILLLLLNVLSLETSNLLMGLFRVSIISSLIGILFMKRSADLTKSELGLKQKVAVAFIFAFPFFLTEFGLVGISVIKMGAIGGLIVTVSCLLFSDENSKKTILRFLVLNIFQSILTAIIFCYVLSSFSLENFMIIFALVLVTLLVPEIIRASLLTKRKRMRNWPLKVIDQFKPGLDPVRHIDNILSVEGAFAYCEKDLGAFDLPIIKAFIKESGLEQFKMDYLKELKNNFASEQLLYILESDQNNTILVLHHEPLVLLSMNNPTLTREIDTDSEQIVLSKFLELSLGVK